MKHSTPPAPETVLFAVVGFSPAILTETAWALAKERPSAMPDRVVAVTTRPGREKIRADLLASGVWENLRRALKAGDRLQFGDTGTHLRVITRGAEELDDIRSRADNEAAADFILEQLRAFTENADTRVVATIAGGRKTMSALLYACMSLIGRETDRVTHVLVDEALERRKPPFYFPANAAEARGIGLADSPFVPLRNCFAKLGHRPRGFGRMVHFYSSQTAPEDDVAATVRFEKDCAVVNGRPVALRARALQTLRYLAHANLHPPLPIGQQEAIEPMIAFLSGEATSWLQGPDDLKRELGEVRRRCREEGVAWMPGIGKLSLRLPPFKRA